MNKTTRSVVSAIVALSAAGLASQLVSWQTIPKACLAGGVAGIVMAILLVVLPVKSAEVSK